MLVKSNYCLHGLLKVKAITSLLVIIMEEESNKGLLRDALISIVSVNLRRCSFIRIEG